MGMRILMGKFPQEMINDIEIYQRKNKIFNNSQALRELVSLGLDNQASESITQRLDEIQEQLKDLPTIKKKLTKILNNNH